jgi:hypothetical protein
MFTEFPTVASAGKLGQGLLGFGALPPAAPAVEFVLDMTTLTGCCGVRSQLLQQSVTAGDDSGWKRSRRKVA